VIICVSEDVSVIVAMLAALSASAEEINFAHIVPRPFAVHPACAEPQTFPAEVDLMLFICTALSSAIQTQFIHLPNPSGQLDVSHPTDLMMLLRPPAPISSS